MRTTRCRQLRSVLTSYVDNEVSAPERLVVEDHLRACHRCCDRVSRERAVRRLLRRWSAEARVDGAPLSWPTGSERLTHRHVSTLRRIAALSTAAIVIVVVIVMWNRWSVDAGVLFAASGQIGDSRCPRGHTHASAELKTISDRDCVRRCVLMGAQYVFVSQGVVYVIRNQDSVDLSQFAGQHVQLEGKMRQNLLTVSHVRPLTPSRSVTDFLTDFFSRKVWVS